MWLCREKELPLFTARFWILLSIVFPFKGSLFSKWNAAPGPHFSPTLWVPTTLVPSSRDNPSRNIEPCHQEARGREARRAARTFGYFAVTSAVLFAIWKGELLKSPTTLTCSGCSGGERERHGTDFGLHHCGLAMAALGNYLEHKHCVSPGQPRAPPPPLSGRGRG